MLSATSNIELEVFIEILQSQHHFIWVLEMIVTNIKVPSIPEDMFSKNHIYNTLIFEG